MHQIAEGNEESRAYVKLQRTLPTHHEIGPVDALLTDGAYVYEDSYDNTRMVAVATPVAADLIQTASYDPHLFSQIRTPLRPTFPPAGRDSVVNSCCRRRNGSKLSGPKKGSSSISSRVLFAISVGA